MIKLPPTLEVKLIKAAASSGYDDILYAVYQNAMPQATNMLFKRNPRLAQAANIGKYVTNMMNGPAPTMRDFTKTL